MGGKGKYRRGKKQRKGPLIVYNCDAEDIVGFRNLPGVESCHVSRLNLLQLAPGGHLGRLVVWTKDAMEALEGVYDKKAESGFTIPDNVIQNSDVTGNLRKRSLPATLGLFFDQKVQDGSVTGKLLG